MQNVIHNLMFLGLLAAVVSCDRQAEVPASEPPASELPAEVADEWAEAEGSAEIELEEVVEF